MFFFSLFQEVALDILARLIIAMGAKKYKDELEGLKANVLLTLPTVIRDAFEDPNVGAKVIAQSMREYLNELNRDSPHISSFQFASFSIEFEGSLNVKCKVMINGGWLDMSKDNVALYVPQYDQLIKFKYDNVARVHCSTEGCCLQIMFDEKPERINEILQAMSMSNEVFKSMRIDFNKGEEEVLCIFSNTKSHRFTHLG